MKIYRNNRNSHRYNELVTPSLDIAHRPQINRVDNACTALSKSQGIATAVSPAGDGDALVVSVLESVHIHRTFIQPLRLTVRQL